jgi:hypothetical protein
MDIWTEHVNSNEVKYFMANFENNIVVIKCQNHSIRFLLHIISNVLGRKSRSYIDEEEHVEEITTDWKCNSCGIRMKKLAYETEDVYTDDGKHIGNRVDYYKCINNKNCPWDENPIGCQGLWSDPRDSIKFREYRRNNTIVIANTDELLRSVVPPAKMKATKRIKKKKNLRTIVPELKEVIYDTFMDKYLKMMAIVENSLSISKDLSEIIFRYVLFR